MKGIYRSTDGGTQWNLFNDGLANKRISTIAAVEKTVFAGTGRGLYRPRLRYLEKVAGGDIQEPSTPWQCLRTISMLGQVPICWIHANRGRTRGAKNRFACTQDFPFG